MKKNELINKTLAGLMIAAMTAACARQLRLR